MFGRNRQTHIRKSVAQRRDCQKRLLLISIGQTIFHIAQAQPKGCALHFTIQHNLTGRAPGAGFQIAFIPNFRFKTNGFSFTGLRIACIAQFDAGFGRKALGILNRRRILPKAKTFILFLIAKLRRYFFRLMGKLNQYGATIARRGFARRRIVVFSRGCGIFKSHLGLLR